MRPSLLTIIYLVIGVVVAASRDYFADIDGVEGLVSAALAIVLWPLVLLGIDLELGDGGNGDGGNGGNNRGSALVPIAQLGSLLAGGERLGRKLHVRVMQASGASAPAER
jgi:hypothetical protein